MADQKKFDVAIVGGGALGCTVAWEAATRGLSVVLIEQDDFGSGASANSLKIVHGGLRYLQKMDLRRARASAVERSALLRIAPHLVRPLACVLPTRRSLLRGRLALTAGLTLNAIVTADRNTGLSAACRLPAGGLVGMNALQKLAPGLNLEGATAGARWFDAQMRDSERLTLSFALGAESRGALLRNHHQVKAYMNDQGRVVGVVAENRLSGEQTEFPASVVLDCRCAWAVSDNGLPRAPDAPPFLKAVNLILPDTGLQCAVAFPMRTRDGRVIPGRMLFATPWNGVTIVGTWYSPAPSGPGAGLDADEAAEMLQAVNWSYGGWQFQPSDILSVHVGYLPALPNSDPEGQEPVPMDYPICEPASAHGGPTGLWHLQTEKWTTVRRLAESCINRLAKEEGLPATRSLTKSLPLPGGEPKALRAAHAALEGSGLPPEVCHRLAYAYGGRSVALVEMVRQEPYAGDPIPGVRGVIAAEVIHAIAEEHAQTLGDLLRRTGIGSAGRPDERTLEYMAELAAPHLGLDSGEQRRQIDEVLRWPQFQLDRADNVS